MRARKRRRPPRSSIAIISASRSARPSRTGASTRSPFAITSAATRSSAPRAATGRNLSRATRASRSKCARGSSSQRACGVGSPEPDPIFIVGLPRSGSTLIEQILASHSRVEGTQELADIQRIGDGASGARSATCANPRYPGVLARIERRGLSAVRREVPERYARLPHGQAVTSSTRCRTTSGTSASST